MERLDASTIQSQPGLSDRFKAWLGQISGHDHPVAPSLPDDKAADTILTSVGVAERDREACIAGRQDPERHPALRWVRRLAYRELVTKRGRNLAGRWYSGWPSLPDRWGTFGQQLYVWVFLAAVPDVQRFYRERGFLLT